MNKAQKEVLQTQLDDEQKTIKQLQRIYGQARKDCESKIRELSARTDLENIQTIVYQKQYQEAMKKQIEGIIDDLSGKQFTSVADYLQQSYYNGYVGVMYDLHQQGIPIIMPINQEQVVKALQTDSKLSKGLYDRLGEDVGYLKRSIRAELSRGIANGSTWNQMAVHIAKGMNSPFKKAINNAIRISRTEGHRIQQRSALDAQFSAKAKGADVLKQWDSTLDNRTRPHHRRLDGQIRELEEDFEVDGITASAPGHFGRASEDCNCRCCLLQRARWALDEDELNELKERAAYFGLDKSSDFADFKQKYLHIPDNADTIDVKSGNWQGINFSQNYKTKKEAVNALSNKYGISFSDSRKYPIDQDILCDAVSWIDAFEKEYPVFVKMNPQKLPKLVVKAPSGMKNAVGYFQYYVNGTPVELALNGQYHTNKSFFEQYEESAKKSKWTVANATTRKTFVHEYGHYVSNSVCAVRGRRWEHDFIQECVDEYKKSHPEYLKTTYAGLQKDCDEVSRYGMTSESECFAETFAEYYGGEDPREFAQIFGKKLDALLKNTQMSTDGKRVLIPNP